MITKSNISTISDLRFKTKDVLAKSDKEPIFLFHRSTPKGVIMSYEKYQELLSSLEDYYLSLKAEGYENEDKEKIAWASHEEVKKLLNK